MSRDVWLGKLIFLLGAGLALAAGPQTFPYPRPLPEPSAEKLPRWRGFNLLYKFNVGSAPTPDRVMVEDYRMIASLGFNFVRIPLDYRGWIVGGDWEKLDEAKLREIDRIVALGGEYGVHVSLNFHRAPASRSRSRRRRATCGRTRRRSACARRIGRLSRNATGASRARN